MSVFRQPLDPAPGPKAKHNANREAGTIRAMDEARKILDRFFAFIGRYQPTQITDATGKRYEVLAIDQGTDPSGLAGSRLHNVTGLTAGLTDPFDIAGDVITAVIGSITPPDPTAFVASLTGLFSTALGTVGGAGSAPSRATVKALVDGYLGSLSGLVGDIGAAVSSELATRATGLPGILETHFSTEGALRPRDGDYIYNEATGIVYVIFKQRDGIPSSNTIFRVPFTVGTATWVALTTFPAPNIGGFVGSIASLVLAAVNALMTLLANLITDTLMGLFALITDIWPLIEDMINAAVAAINDAIEAIQEILETLETVQIIKADGYSATVGVLGNAIGTNKKLRIDFVRSDTGYGAEANVIVIDGYATPIVDQVDWEEINYLSQDMKRMKVKVLTRIAESYPKEETITGAWEDFDVIMCDNGEQTIVVKPS